MGAGTYALVKTVISGETITAADRNSEHQNHINNQDFAGLDDYSANVTQMQATTDPYPAAVETLATDGKGELERIRYLIKQITGQAQWYIDPTQILSFSLGTAALPYYSIAGDPNTGRYSSAANNIDEATDGIRRLNIGNTGNITLYGNSAAGAANATILAVVSGNTAVTAINMGDTDASDDGAVQYNNNTRQLIFRAASGNHWTVDSNGFLNPASAGTLDIGSAATYINGLYYKTLNDQGCLGSFDKGVEMQNGRFVSDTEALLAIKTHPTKKTVYGVDMFDYKTFPKVSYKKAMKDGRLIPRDTTDEPIFGSDGVEMTSMFSIMIGAIRELALKIKALEVK